LDIPETARDVHMTAEQAKNFLKIIENNIDDEYIQEAIEEVLLEIPGYSSGGRLVDIIKENDTFPATDDNVFSSLRILKEIANVGQSSHSHFNKDILDKLSQSDLEVLSILRLVDGKLEIGADAYSVGEISAYGAGEEGAGGGEVNSLNDLVDVALTSLSNGNVLIYNGTHWENKPQSDIVPDLSLLNGHLLATNNPHSVTFPQLLDKPTTVLGYGITDAYTKSEINNKLAAKIDRSIFDDLFEKIEVSEGIFAIKANYNFYSVGEISAYGMGNIGSGGETGVSALSELADVTLTVPNAGDLLLYNGTHWVNRPQSTIMPDLSGYATIEYVNNAITTVDTDKTYIFVQGTPSNVWTVAHNLNKYPNVSVVDSGNTEVIGEIKYIDINTVQITFSSEFSGKAFCN
jgi:hypothetical protein